MRSVSPTNSRKSAGSHSRKSAGSKDPDGSVARRNSSDELQAFHIPDDEALLPHSGSPDDSHLSSGRISLDPMGTNSTHDDNSSTHGEALMPTKDYSFDELDEETLSLPQSTDNMKHSRSSNSNGKQASSQESFTEVDLAYDAEPNVGDASLLTESIDLLTTTDKGGLTSSSDGLSSRFGSNSQHHRNIRFSSGPPSSDAESSTERAEGPSQHSKAEEGTPLKHSKFPSVTQLVCLGSFIILLLLGMAGGLTWYLWEQERLDPIRPPGYVGGGSNEAGNNIFSRPTDYVLPQDETLMDLFEIVSGADARDTSTPAGMAAQWMLQEDPARHKPEYHLMPRSTDAWIQRYVLVELYFATTSNRSRSWLSCSAKETETSDCQFSNPTELPTGKLLYDLVPSQRWLSGSDECTWGGVACGVTLTETVSVPVTEEGNDQSNESTTTRLEEHQRSAVTSIVLAGQNLEGPLPVNLVTSLPHLKTLDLSHNDLTGSLVRGFARMKILRLQYNNLDGTLPDGFFDNSSLRELNLGANRFAGSLPGTLGTTASQLTSLKVFGNDFMGRLPVLGSDVPLRVFHAQDNEFTGSLPFESNYGGNWPETLEEWWVQHNRLTGSIPAGIGWVQGLRDLRIHHNLLTGTIPGSLGILDYLFRFEAHSNKLTGSLPDGLGDLSELRDVKIQFNRLTGAIPSSLCFSESLTVLEADCLPGRPPSDGELPLLVLPSGEEVENDVGGSKNPSNTIPSFATLDEAVAAFRGQNTPSAPSHTNNNQQDVTTQKKESPKDYVVQCYCCTQCCSAKTQECYDP